MRHFAAIAVTFVILTNVALAGEAEVDAETNECGCEAVPMALKDDLWSKKTLFRWAVAPADEENEEDGIDERIVTDRPHFSEASSLVGKGVIQVESGYTYFSDTFAGGSTQTHSFPEQLFRIGMFADWFEFRFAYNFLNELDRPADDLPTQFGGADDLYLGAKLALFEQVGLLPEMAIFPQTRIPAGHDAFTAKQLLPGANLAYGWMVNKLIEIEANTQLNRRVDDNGVYYAEFIQTGNIEYDISDYVGAFTEYFGLFPAGASSTATGPEHYLHGGIVLFPTPNIQFDIHAGWGLNRHSDDFFGGVGLSFRFGKPVKEQRLKRQFQNIANSI